MQAHCLVLDSSNQHNHILIVERLGLIYSIANFKSLIPRELSLLQILDAILVSGHVSMMRGVLRYRRKVLVPKM